MKRGSQDFHKKSEEQPKERKVLADYIFYPDFHKKSEEQPKERKVLADYIFCLGLAKQASDYGLVSQFIINHIQKEFTNGDDIGDALEDKQEVDLDAHRPSITMSQAQDVVTRDKEDQESEKIFEVQVRVFVARQAMYTTNKRKAFTLICEQCHKTLQSKLKARANYDTEIKGDPIKMLQAIQEYTMSYQGNWYDVKIVTDAIRNIIYTKQHDDEDLVDYTRRFKTAKEFLEAQLGGKLKIDKKAKEDEEWDETDATKMKECHEQANARLMALMYLENADQNKYGTVLKGLMDQFSLNQDQYPKTVNHATSVLSGSLMRSTSS
jgi:hypothetical protein